MKRKIIPYKERTSISYFKDGVLCDVFPFDPNLSLYKNRNYESRFIVSDGIQYDLINKEDIQNIPIPHFSTNGWHTVDSLDYYLRMCASNLRSAKEFELSTLLLKKAFELMQHSTISWQEKDYYRLVQWLYEDGEFEEADEYEKRINSAEILEKSNTAFIRKNHLENYKNESDLIALHSYSRTCEYCSIYSGRVYSVSGDDLRFPFLDENIVDTVFNHICCSSCFLSYWESMETIYYLGKKVNAVESTNRPYEDLRTDEQKTDYDNALENALWKQLREDEYKQCHKEYYLLKYKFPELAPKSVYAYSSIKQANDENFKNIQEKAKKFGIEIQNPQVLLEDIIAHSKE